MTGVPLNDADDDLTISRSSSSYVPLPTPPISAAVKETTSPYLTNSSSFPPPPPPYLMTSLPSSPPPPPPPRIETSVDDVMDDLIELDREPGQRRGAGRYGNRDYGVTVETEPEVGAASKKGKKKSKKSKKRNSSEPSENGNNGTAVDDDEDVNVRNIQEWAAAADSADIGIGFTLLTYLLTIYLFIYLLAVVFNVCDG